MPPRRSPRIILLANTGKLSVVEALRTFRPWLAERARIVAEPDYQTLTRKLAADLPKADLAIVLGGDGTVLAQARHMADVAVPMLGVNFGKLGFLAEFSIDELQQHWDYVTNPRCPTTRRVMLDLAVYNGRGNSDWITRPRQRDAVFTGLAMNDAVITAGPPYRMIEVEIGIDPMSPQTEGTTFSGDGVIVATPSGSTAYNLAAGGPIVSPDVDAFTIVPICPHSLAFRPIVVNSRSIVQLRMHRANEGTTLVIDGQKPVSLSEGQRVYIRRHGKALHLIEHPTRSYWQMISRKLHWAARPISR